MARDWLGRQARMYLGLSLAIFGFVALGIRPGGTPWFSLLYFGSALACFWPFRKQRQKGKAGAAEVAVLSEREGVIALVNHWNALADGGRFDSTLKKLEDVKQRLVDLPGLRAASIKALAENAAKVQRNRFLSLFRIDRATLPRLTDSDIAMLASHNIDSADDVLRENNQLERLVGIWNARELDAWASAQEKKFAFDATRSLDPDDVREVDQLIQAQQEQLLAELEKGEKDLRLLVREMESRRESVRRDIEQARATLARAEKELA